MCSKSNGETPIATRAYTPSRKKYSCNISGGDTADALRAVSRGLTAGDSSSCHSRRRQVQNHFRQASPVLKVSKPQTRHIEQIHPAGLAYSPYARTSCRDQMRRGPDEGLLFQGHVAAVDSAEWRDQDASERICDVAGRGHEGLLLSPVRC